MARSSIFTSLALIASLVSGCAGSGGSAQDNGGTDANEADPTAQKDPTGDVDTDGLPADQDLCPGTAAGAKVDGNGCSDEQRSGGNKGGKRNADGTIDGAAGATNDGGDTSERDIVSDGDVTPNGFAVFTLDPEGAVPVVFRTLASNVTTLENGFSLSGTVMIDVPNNQHVTLVEAKVSLEYDSARGKGLQSFNGSARLPFPNLGYMSNVSVKDPIYAAVGYDLGKNLTQVEAPLKDERKYLYFTFSAGLEASIGDLTISAGPGQSATITLDPSDPAFFLAATWRILARFRTAAAYRTPATSPRPATCPAPASALRPARPMSRCRSSTTARSKASSK